MAFSKLCDDITTVSVCAVLVDPIEEHAGKAPEYKEEEHAGKAPEYKEEEHAGKAPEYKELDLFWKKNQQYGGIRYRKNAATPKRVG